MALRISTLTWIGWLATISITRRAILFEHRIRKRMSVEDTRRDCQMSISILRATMLWPDL